ncbi:MAG TPA: hypothetical protein PKY38_00405 [Opitutaceae bacterium]|mgnify:FL=1|nr:hypothetical protein [Opitutaceae bacterium]
MLRVIIIFSLIAIGQASDALPADVVEACKDFHAENPRGWSFIQTTTAGPQIMVESYDAGRPEFSRWRLLARDGRPPTESESRTYAETRSRRSRGGTAPDIAGQLDLTTAEPVAVGDVESIYRFRLKRAASGDRTAENLRAIVTFHHPTGTIRRFELTNIQSFSPVLGVRITEMHTSIHYHLPTDNRPALLDRITTRTRGRAYFKSLDADMVVIFSEYSLARRSPQAMPAGGPDAGKAD